MKRFASNIALILFSFILLSGGCDENKEKKSSKKEKTQTEASTYKFTSYDEAWAEVETNLESNLPKSALNVVSSIMERSLAEKNQPHITKALLYQINIKNSIEEFSVADQLKMIESIEKKGLQPLNHILASLKGDTYLNFMRQNRFRISERTEVKDFDLEDPETWTTKALYDNAVKSYQASINDKALLQKINIKEYEILTTNQKGELEDAILSNPTLYDALAQKLLNVFKQDERFFDLPEKQFTIDGEHYFGSTIDFLAINTDHEDLNSPLRNYVLVMKDLLRFHQSNNYPIAKVRYELARLDFAKQHSIVANANALYESGLKSLISSTENHQGKLEAQLKLAEYYNDSERFKEAHSLLTKMLESNKESKLLPRVNALKNKLEKKELSLHIRALQIPDRPILVKADYRNNHNFIVRVYKQKDKKTSANIYSDSLEKTVKKLSLVQERTVNAPKKDDFQNHNTEFTLNALPIGDYFIIISDELADYASKERIHSIAKITVSTLFAEAHYSNEKEAIVSVKNAITGTPNTTAQVKIFEVNYNGKKSKYDSTLVLNQKVNTLGTVKISSLSTNKLYVAEISDGSEATKVEFRNYYYSSVERQSEIDTVDHLFTDRAIYRPGQTVYFKGVRVQNSKTKKTVVAKDEVYFNASDFNGKVIADLEFHTNDFGSFHGSFRIPVTGINGTVELDTDFGTATIQVEEYKRPTFKVEIPDNTDELKINELVQVKGNAIAFSGASVDNAKVSYVVKRLPRYSYWGYQRGLFLNTSNVIINEGKTTTDKDGTFKFEFLAIADLTEQDISTYNFIITVDVTDANGETRSTTKTINLGKSAYYLSLDAPTTVQLGEATSVKISAFNAFSKPVNTSGTITVTQLISKDQAGFDAPWVKTEHSELSDEEYSKLFPYVLREEQELKEQKGKVVQTIVFNTQQTNPYKLNNLPAGKYLIEAVSKDKFGVEVTQSTSITVFDMNSKLASKSTLSTFIAKENFQSGETVNIAVSSALKDLYVNLDIRRNGRLIETRVVQLNNEQKLITYKIPVNAVDDRFNFVFRGFYMGEHVNSLEEIYVTAKKQELSISFETYRDVLTPGQQEEWRLRVTGPNKEKVAAEMVLSMYDASLNQFAAHNFVPKFPYYYNQSDYFFPQNEDNWKSYTYTTRINQKDIYYSKYSPSTIRFIQHETNYVTFALSPNKAARRVNLANNWASDDSGYVSEVVEKMSLESLDNVSAEHSYSINTNENATQQSSTEEKGAMRTNLNETAFFFPELRTDKNGDILLTFKSPESLTTWKILGFAHTKDFIQGLVEKEVITQKELMIQPNLPRFIRNGDEVVLTAKISNLLEKVQSGEATIQLIDATTNEDVTTKVGINNNRTIFSVDAKGSTVVSWKVKPTTDIEALTIRVLAKAEKHTDGEENTIPVLTDKILITESLPLTTNGIGTQTYEFTKLVNSKETETMKHHAVTLEYASNPAWYVIQALPYMMEYPHECSEQIFTRLYANVIGSHIVNSSPRIKQVFEQWKNTSPQAFLSNLEKNQQLKSILLEETPWVLNAVSESERKKRVALLFDFAKMSEELQLNIDKLSEAQGGNGGFSWFEGMPENRYITEYILLGIGKLKQLEVLDVSTKKQLEEIATKAINFLDNKVLEDYNLYLKSNDNKDKVIYSHNYNVLQYLYARSFFAKETSDKLQKALDFYTEEMTKNWTLLNINQQAMFALYANRANKQEVAAAIMKSIKERSIQSKDLGMYWKENERGYFWYQAPIETQAMIIDALVHVSKDVTSANQAKIWLLRNKQTTDWKTTTATMNASYALLLGGSPFSEDTNPVKIVVNGKEINPSDFGSQAEAGTGYFQKTWTGQEVSAGLGNIQITSSKDQFAYGAMYWQYYESMEKVTSTETNLKLKKHLFKVVQTASGQQMTPVKDGEKLQRGDLIRVRIELRSDRVMEFVHMKDYRSAGFEPVNVFSQYKWRDGLGYYESTKDVATNFFFDYLPKGTFVFEYDMRVFHSGNFTNGVTSIQCVYAPEFTSHSEGVRVTVE